jgi:hypothetical protein
MGRPSFESELPDTVILNFSLLTRVLPWYLWVGLVYSLLMIERALWWLDTISDVIEDLQLLTLM